MTGKKQVNLDSLRLSEQDFDQMMRKAVQAGQPPEDKAKGKHKKKVAEKRKIKR